MRNPRLERFEADLDTILHEVDAELEAEYTGRYPLHPARPAQGETANPQYDGLFTILAKFTAGFGSKLGPGYTLELRVSSLAPIPPADQKHFEQYMVDRLRARLPAVFPDRTLAIDRDTTGWKLHGDLSLNR